MPFIQTQQYEIHYQELNKESSQTIIMIHGINSNMSVFYFKIAPLLANHYHVVLYDMKGHGLSGFSHNGYDLDGMAGDLVFLMNEINIQKSHIVGYSYGGLVALKMVLLQPQMADKIVIIDSPLMEQIKGQQHLIDNKDIVEKYLLQYAQSMHFQPKKRHLEKNKKTLEVLLNNTSFVDDFFEKNQFFTEELQSTSFIHKTLLLYANQSDYIQSGNKLNDIIPASKLKIGIGDHNLPLQDPVWISNNVIDFLK